jgi:tRNA (mo5U34)-methyltransferase
VVRSGIVTRGGDAPGRDEIEARVRTLGPWLHDLELDGIRTAPDTQRATALRELWATLEASFPSDMTGRTVLDVGCNAGFFTFRLAERGAAVTGIDHDPHALKQARFAADVLGHDVELLEMDVYEARNLGRRFDYVLFLGVLPYLRYPLLGLDRVREVVGARLVFQTPVRGAPGVMEAQVDYPSGEEEAFHDARFPRLHFLEHRYGGDAAWWWLPNESGAAGLLRAAGFRIEEHAGPGVYLCALEEERAQ